MTALKTPRGSISTRFKSISEIFDLIGGIILGKELFYHEPFKNAAQRKMFFSRIKKDRVLFHGYERRAVSCNFENLPILEKEFGVRLYIWQRYQSLGVVSVYESRLENLNCPRVNLLSLDSDPKSLRNLFLIYDQKVAFTMFTSKKNFEIVRMNLFTALSQKFYPNNPPSSTPKFYQQFTKQIYQFFW